MHRESGDAPLRSSLMRPGTYRGLDRAELLPGAYKRPDLGFADALAAFDRSIIREQVLAAERERQEVVRLFPSHW